MSRGETSGNPAGARRPQKSARSKANAKPTGAAAAGEGQDSGEPQDAGVTVSHVLGEMVWLLTQSPLHRGLSISDIEWLLMPALMHEQFYLFRDGERPVGLALWAQCSPAAVKKLEGGMIEPANRLTVEEWQSGSAIWLVDLIAPFATSENMYHQIMIADLATGPLQGKAFNFHVTDPETGKRQAQIIPANAGAQITQNLKDVLAKAKS